MAAKGGGGLGGEDWLPAEASEGAGQLLLEPALQCAVGIDAPFQLCPQSLDLGQEVMQVTERVLPLPAFS